MAVFGGVLAGTGLGLIFMRGATTGGSEIVGPLLERKFHHIPIGRLILLVDALVVAASAVVYGNIESALYAMVMIFVSSSMMDALVYGADKGKMLLIMTRKEREIADAVLERMKRGVTMLNATGRLHRRGKTGTALRGAAVGNVSASHPGAGSGSLRLYDRGIHRRGAGRGLQNPW